jgi:hypothetical protein
VRLVSIIGFISAGFMILGGVAGGVVGVLTGRPEAAALIFIYPLMGLVYLVPSFYLFRFATRIGEYMQSGQEAQLELALDSQRSFWRFVGILSIIGIVLMVLGIAAAITIPALLQMRGQ